MVLGIYYLTQERPGAKGEGKYFKDISEAILAYENGVITLHSMIIVNVNKRILQREMVRGVIKSTLGRFLFNRFFHRILVLLTEQA